MSPDDEQSPIPADRLAELLDAVRRLATCDDPDRVLDEIVQSVCAVGRFGSAVVNVVQPDGEVEVVAAAGAGSLLVGTRAPLETWQAILDGASRWRSLRYLRHDDDQSVLGGMPSVMPGAVPDEPTSWSRWHPGDILVAPLVAADGALLGALSVDEPEDGRWPDEEHCTVLELLASQAARTLTDAGRGDGPDRPEDVAGLRRSVAELRHLAGHDDLTGLANRRSLIDRLTTLLDADPGAPPAIAVLAGDLDGFKLVNDRYGHAAGDELLVQAASRLRSVLGPALVLSRLGGDEFVAVLAEDALAPGELERIARRCVETMRRPFDLEVGRCSVTISIGIARSSEPGGASATELLRRADRALYAAKGAGRDRWEARRA